MGPEPIVEAVGLTRSFGDKAAVEDLKLAILPGEIYGFVGPNGAGKTTTIRLLLGLVASTSGEIRLFGSPVRRGRADLRQVGAMVERPGLYPHLTGAENLRVFSSTRGTELSGQGVHDALRSAGLDPTDRRQVRKYSAGMRQRLALAVALGGRPALLILDEPTDGLDPIGIVDMRNAIAVLADQGTTVFLSSHLLSEVEKICSRIGILIRGRLVREGNVADLSRDAAQIVVEFSGSEAAAQAVRHLVRLGFRAWQGASPLEALLPAKDTDMELVATALSAVGISPSQVFVREIGLEELFVNLATQEASSP